MRKYRTVLISLFLIGAASSCSGLFTNVAETSRAAPPELRTRVYPRDIHTVRKAVREIVSGWERWKVVGEAACCTYFETDKEPIAKWEKWEEGVRPDDVGVIGIEIQTKMFKFTDDMTVFLIPTDTTETTVDVHSASRTGKGDFGVNAKNIAALLKALDEKIKAPVSWKESQ
ncbi:MAG: DUF1499 domain-containing protein [Bdellovibrionota bacterium]